MKSCHSAHPNPDSTNIPNTTMDRDELFTRILFIVQIESGHLENIAFNGRGSCPQTYPETVAQKRRPKHHNGRKNLVNGRSKEKAKMLGFPRSPR